MTTSNVDGAHIAKVCKLCQHLTVSKSSYHHGELSSALTAAAMAAVERDGPQALSLRDVAHSLGVSRAAPYRHFRDRDALLAAVAAKGFEDLVGIYEAALSEDGNGRQRLRRLLLSYMEFARTRPGLHALMFESDLLQRSPPPQIMIPVATRAYELLWRAVEGAFPKADQRWVKQRTVTMLSTIVGFRVLDNVGRFRPFMINPLTRKDLVEAVLEAAIGDSPAS